VLDGADGNGVVAFSVREHDGLFSECADGENGRLGLVDNRRAELVAEDAGVGERERGSADFIGRELLGACARGEVVDGARQIGADKGVEPVRNIGEKEFFALSKTGDGGLDLSSQIVHVRLMPPFGRRVGSFDGTRRLTNWSDRRGNGRP